MYIADDDATGCQCSRGEPAAEKERSIDTARPENSVDPTYVPRDADPHVQAVPTGRDRTKRRPAEQPVTRPYSRADLLPPR